MSGHLEENLKWFDALFDDPTVIEIVINGDGHCFVERQGKSIMVRAEDFDLDPIKAGDIAGQAANATGNKLSVKQPLLSTTVEHREAMLRVQAVVEPASRQGTVLSFRIFRHAVSGEPKQFKFLRDDVSISRDAERIEILKDAQEKVRTMPVDDFLKHVLDKQLNTIISGGTSTGKTELGRRMLWLVSDNERLVTIEDSFELRPRQPNVVNLIADRETGSPRSPDKLLEATLRLRPDRIIVGELRGSEAATFIEAINTGHGGSFTTLHAQSARKAMDRLALMVMSKGSQLRYNEVLRYLDNTIDVVIQAGRIGDDRGIDEVYFPPLESRIEQPRL